MSGKAVHSVPRRCTGCTARQRALHCPLHCPLHCILCPLHCPLCPQHCLLHCTLCPLHCPLHLLHTRQPTATPSARTAGFRTARAAPTERYNTARCGTLRTHCTAHHRTRPLRPLQHLPAAPRCIHLATRPLQHTPHVPCALQRSLQHCTRCNTHVTRAHYRTPPTQCDAATDVLQHVFSRHHADTAVPAAALPLPCPSHTTVHAAVLTRPCAHTRQHAGRCRGGTVQRGSAVSSAVWQGWPRGGCLVVVGVWCWATPGPPGRADGERAAAP